MKITNKQRKQLINTISLIQYNLGQITISIDDSSSTNAIGIILKQLSVLTEAINNADEEEHDMNKEIWF